MSEEKKGISSETKTNIALLIVVVFIVVAIYGVQDATYGVVGNSTRSIDGINYSCVDRRRAPSQCTWENETLSCWVSVYRDGSYYKESIVCKEQSELVDN